MKKNNKIKTTKTKKELAEEEEKRMIFAKADERKGNQIFVVNEGGLTTEKEIKMFAFGSVEDPEKKYEVYYKGLMRLLRKHLPTGKVNAEARSYIYEEKNTFLTRGKRKNKVGIRGGDSRMGYIADAEEILNIIASWILSKGTMWELFSILRNINITKGYGKPAIG